MIGASREDATLDSANALALVKTSRLHNDTHQRREKAGEADARSGALGGRTTPGGCTALQWSQ
ncbi:MAG: hypothetical protein LBB55_05730 [Zoogloeaceae bacterium]|jgi:hypothetical protein|nr:hypothetical protein [Zoogloeaceae bacterium]